MKPALLSFRQVCFGYDQSALPILESLDFSLEEGRITAILGPNGAGKTTLLYLALGWLKAWQGEIRLSGKPIGSFGRRALGQQIALIPQSEHLPFEYTVLEYVLLGRAPYLPPLGMPEPADEMIAYEALEKAGIADLYNHSIMEISGGERQLVLLARALAQQPRLLLLDEPTAHLDLSNKFRLMRLIQELQQSGTSILLTTHEPEIALAISETTILMEKRGVLISGPTSEITTEENLSRIYHVPLRIISVEGRKQVIWI
ncbi:MAG: ABC transporter ATP-binding protein [Anaerolineae bacterium]|jgi:iron complex transport system ATP-binding protein|nr:ABC transporter ATP-binding protein [Anaerolineae bacterium]